MVEVEMESKWYHNVRKIAWTAGILMVSTAALLYIIFSFDGTDVMEHQYISIVLDGSKQMQAPFDGTSRWEAVHATVDSYLAQKGLPHVTLKRFGGHCESRTETLTSDGPNQTAYMTSRLNNFSLGGINTLTQVIDELGLQERKITLRKRGEKPPAQSKQTVILTSAPEDCSKALASLQKPPKPLPWGLHVIGLDLNQEQAALVASHVEAEGGRFTCVENQEQLWIAFNRAVEIAPIIADANYISTVEEMVRDEMTVAVQHLNDGLGFRAKSVLEKAQQMMTWTDAPMARLSKKESQIIFARMVKLSHTVREDHKQMLNTVEEMILAWEAGNEATQKQAMKQYVALRREWKDSQDALDKLMAIIDTSQSWESDAWDKFSPKEQQHGLALINPKL